MKAINFLFFCLVFHMMNKWIQGSRLIFFYQERCSTSLKIFRSTSRKFRGPHLKSTCNTDFNILHSVKYFSLINKFQYSKHTLILFWVIKNNFRTRTSVSTDNTNKPKIWMFLFSRNYLLISAWHSAQFKNSVQLFIQRRCLSTT